MITCIDCIEGMKLLEDNYVDLILTDIPYGEINRKSNGLRNLDKKDADIIEFNLDKFIDECIRICSGSIYIFCGTRQAGIIRDKLSFNKLSTRLIIWEKTNPSPMNGQYIWLSGIELCVYAKKPKATFNKHCKNTVLKYPSGRSKIHPTQKPLGLFEELILTSTNENDIVLDPCCGSGTTAIASIKNNRNYMCFDINPDYIEITKDRINCYTDKEIKEIFNNE